MICSRMPLSRREVGHICGVHREIHVDYRVFGVFGYVEVVLGVGVQFDFFRFYRQHALPDALHVLA